jgi:hypothetical protein
MVVKCKLEANQLVKRIHSSVKSAERPSKKLAKAMAALDMCRELRVIESKKSEVDGPGNPDNSESQPEAQEEKTAISDD